jgi:hypothetical protein
MSRFFIVVDMTDRIQDRFVSTVIRSVKTANCFADKISFRPVIYRCKTFHNQRPVKKSAQPGRSSGPADPEFAHFIATAFFADLQDNFTPGTIGLFSRIAIITIRFTGVLIQPAAIIRNPIIPGLFFELIKTSFA